MQHITWRRLALGFIAILAIALSAGACGSTGGQSSNSPTEVQITLSEFKIEPPQAVAG
jgi:hypothetical protein